MKLEYIVDDNCVYKNVNDVLKLEFHFSSCLITKLINNMKIYLNGSICDTRYNISPKDIITIDLNIQEDSLNIVPTKMDLDILYEDKWLLAVNKSYGIPVHPSRLHYTDSLSNGIKYYFDSISLKTKIRPINRLDLNTTGIVLFAKSQYIQDILSKQMINKKFKKEYLCIVSGKLINKSGTIDLPISRKPGSIIERCIDDKGQKSITHYEVIKEFSNYTLIKCVLETGRTHQIRVHMSALGHPIVSDTLYGNFCIDINRQALHSYMVEFIHPVYHNKVSIISPLPKDMENLLVF